MKKYILFLFVSCLLILFSFTNEKSVIESKKIDRLPFNAVTALSDFRLELNKAQIRNMLWVDNVRVASVNKSNQEHFVFDNYSKMKEQLNIVFESAPEEDKSTLKIILKHSDSLVGEFKYVLTTLFSIKDYDNAEKVFPVRATATDDDGDCMAMLKGIDVSLAELINKYQLKINSTLSLLDNDSPGK